MARSKNQDKFHDEHFKGFTVSLEKAIAKYNQAYDPKKGNSVKNLTGVSKQEFLKRQKVQVETLVGLEKKFRTTLINHRWGVKVYKAFIDFIRKERRNILDARPFFRERQTVFTKFISKAIRDGKYDQLWRFNFNYRFIRFVLQVKNWAPKSQIMELGNKIKEIRSQLVVMNMPLAISRARIFYSRTPKAHLSYMDLVQIAADGLLSGIDKFVLPFSKMFRGVAVGRIVGSLIENYCISVDTILQTCNKEYKFIKDFIPGDKILGVNNEGQTIKTEVVALHDHGILEGYEVTFDDGYQITCSKDHKFLTSRGMVPLRDIATLQIEVLCVRSENWRLASPLWDNPLSKKEIFNSSQGVSKMPSVGLGSSMYMDNEGACQIYEKRWMALQVWGKFGQQKGTKCSPKELRSFSIIQKKRTNCSKSRALCEMEEGKPRSGYQEVCRRQGDIQSKAEGRPGLCQETLGKGHFSYQEMETRPSRGVCLQHKESLVVQETFKNGSLDEIQWYSDLGRGEREVFWGAETSRFRISRPQDLGRIGREFSFHRSFQETFTPSQDSGPRRNVKERGTETQGHNVNPGGGVMLLQRHRQDEARMAPMVYSHAPLASTGNLVCRRVVRVRAVGKCRMYDLEVAHPKHNFLLPNGIVTSNSETQLHFFPLDKRKIYRANKLIGKQGAIVDYDDLANKVNIDSEPCHLTTGTEIANLMAAASCVSIDQPPAEGESPIRINVDRYAAPLDAQPNSIVENADARDSMAKAIPVLTIRERKVLKLKGISID